MLRNEFSHTYDLEEYCRPKAVMEAEDLWGFQNEITELDELVEIKKNDKSTVYKTLRERLHNLNFILERVDLGQILIRGL